MYNQHTFVYTKLMFPAAERVAQKEGTQSSIRNWCWRDKGEEIRGRLSLLCQGYPPRPGTYMSFVRVKLLNLAQ